MHVVFCKYSLKLHEESQKRNERQRETKKRRRLARCVRSLKYKGICVFLLPAENLFCYMRVSDRERGGGAHKVKETSREKQVKHRKFFFNKQKVDG